MLASTPVKDPRSSIDPRSENSASARRPLRSCWTDLALIRPMKRAEPARDLEWRVFETALEIEIEHPRAVVGELEVGEGRFETLAAGR